MRSLLLGVAALLALAIPSLASAETGGHIKLTYASIENDDEFEFLGENDNTIALSGVVITDVSDRWRIQFNATTADTESRSYYYCYYFEEDCEQSEAHAQAEVHATYAVNNFDVGVFAGMFQDDGFDYFGLGNSGSYYVYGAEAAINFSRGEINGSVAGATSRNNDLADDITSYVANGTFNLTENLSIGATISNTNFGTNIFFSDEETEVDSYGVSLAYHIPNSDFAVGIGYRSSDVDYGDEFSTETEYVGVSVAWSFGEGHHGRVMPGASALIPDAIASLDFFD